MRDDLSTKLIHFVKGSVEEATTSFRSILQQYKIIGGTGDIVGNSRCVCFTEAPIGKFSGIFSNPEKFSFRYAPLGIMVDKKWLYEQGGRPVIYQSAKEIEFLHDDLLYLHKEYDPRAIDYMWEREWRIRIDELKIDPKISTVIVPDRIWVENFKNMHITKIRTQQIIGLPGIAQKLPWHFIALEDLGVEVQWGKGELGI